MFLSHGASSLVGRRRWTSKQVCYITKNAKTLITTTFEQPSRINNPGSSPGGLMVRIPGFHCRGLGSVPGLGTKILQATWHSQKQIRINSLPFI